MVLNTETWYLNLDSANTLSDDPEWNKLYDAKTEYNMKSLLPQEWYAMVTKAATDDALFKTYYRYEPFLPEEVAVNLETRRVTQT